MIQEIHDSDKYQNVILFKQSTIVCKKPLILFKINAHLKMT